MTDYHLLVAAFICFILAAVNVPVRINFVGAGLAFWIATFLF